MASESPTKNYSGAAAARLQGFSLVEMMVAISIAAFLIAGILSSYTFLGRNLIRDANAQQLGVKARRILQMLVEDVHAATDVSSFSSSQLALTLPYVHSDYSVTTYTVTYTYSSGSIVRSVTGTPPPGDTSATLTLLTGISGFSFSYLDTQGNSVTSSGYAFRIKQIELSNFTLTSGTANAGTKTIYTGTSARFVLRSKHLVLTQNGTSY